MRILTLSYEFPPLGGGGSKVVHGLSLEFLRAGHEVDVVTMAYRDLPAYEVVDGIPVHRVPCLRRSVDISHPHELASYLVRALPAARSLAGRKSYDIIHCHFILPDGLVGLRLRNKLGIPVVVTAHGSDVPNYNPDRFKLLHKLIGPMWRRAAKSIDRIVCPSQFLERLILEQEPGARTVAIPNGLDTGKFDPGARRKRSMLVVTRMLERKGVQDVLRAMVGTDFGYELNIVGTGPYLDSLVELSRKLQVKATFHGWLDNNSTELKELFETSSIFLFPSHAENFPLVLLEAMAAGLAIVTTNETGCREVVGDAALCISPGDEVAIRDAIAQLVTDPDLLRRLGDAARIRLESKFSWPAVAARYLDVFREEIGRVEMARRSAGAPFRGSS